MPTVINPTPGRVVWFYPNIHFLGVRPDVGQPLGARIARVWNDRMVNLAVDDANGAPCSVTSVPLLQEGDEFPTDGRSYCTWMPYQVGQAKKAVPAHQQRVLDEKADLDDKSAKLKAFFDNPIFVTLGTAEQARLRAQYEAMGLYSDILGERIAAF